MAYFPIPINVSFSFPRFLLWSYSRTNKNHIFFTSNFDRGKISKPCHFFLHLLIPLTFFISSSFYLLFSMHIFFLHGESVSPPFLKPCVASPSSKSLAIAHSFKFFTIAPSSNKVCYLKTTIKGILGLM